MEWTITVTNDGRCIMTQLKSLSMKFLPIFCENCINIFKIFSSTTIYRLFIDLHVLTMQCISTSIGEASYFWNRNSDRIRTNLNEIQVQYQEFCISTKKSDWNSWSFLMFNKHLSSNQILCFFVVILTTINCCRNQPHEGLDSEPTCKRIKMKI